MKRKLLALKLAVFTLTFPLISLACPTPSITYLKYNDCAELNQQKAIIYIYQPDNCDFNCQQFLSFYKSIATESHYYKHWKFFIKHAMPAAPIALAQYSIGNSWEICNTLITTVPVIRLNDPIAGSFTFTNAGQLVNYFLSQERFIQDNYHS